MRNLKRALSLALAAVMLIGMMAVGTSAASVDGFTDADKITNLEAASVTTAIGIFAGYDDGSFGADDYVTRAQMATIICKILNGSNVNADIFKGVGKFQDLGDAAWAEGFINMCYSMGIIAGTSDTTFDPNRPVKTWEASLMLQRALGWWAANDPANSTIGELTVTTKGTALNMYGELTLLPTEYLTRNDVAEMVYHTIVDCVPVAYNESFALYRNASSTNFFSGVEYAYNDTLAYQTFGLVYMADEDNFGRPATTWGYGKLDTSDSGDIDVDGHIKSDYNRMVTALATVVHTPVLEYTTEVTGRTLYSDLGLRTSALLPLVIDGCFVKTNATYNLDGSVNTEAVTYGVNVSRTGGALVGDNGLGAFTGNGILTQVFKIDAENDGDPEYKVVVINTYLMRVTGVAEVTRTNPTAYVTVGTTTETYTAKNTTYAHGTYRDSNYNTSEFERDDVVLVTMALEDRDLVPHATENKYKIQSMELAENFTGIMTRFTERTGTMAVDGVTYSFDANASQDANEYNKAQTAKIGLPVTIYMDNYGYAIQVSGEVAESVTNYALVLAVDTDSATVFNTNSAWAQLLLTDGTIVETKIKWSNDPSANKEWTYDALADRDANHDALEGVAKLSPAGNGSGNRNWIEPNETKDSLVENIQTLVSYVKNNDGTYTLYKLLASGKDTWSGVTTDNNRSRIYQYNTNGSGAGNTVYTNDNTVMIVDNGNGKYDIQVGVSNLPTINDVNGAYGSTQIALNADGGTLARVIYTTAQPDSGSSSSNDVIYLAAKGDWYYDVNDNACIPFTAVINGEVREIVVEGRLTTDEDGAGVVVPKNTAIQVGGIYNTMTEKNGIVTSMTLAVEGDDYEFSSNFHAVDAGVFGVGSTVWYTWQANASFVYITKSGDNIVAYPVDVRNLPSDEHARIIYGVSEKANHEGEVVWAYIIDGVYNDTQIPVISAGGSKTYDISSLAVDTMILVSDGTNSDSVVLAKIGGDGADKDNVNFSAAVNDLSLPGYTLTLTTTGNKLVITANSSKFNIEDITVQKTTPAPVSPASVGVDGKATASITLSDTATSATLATSGAISFTAGSSETGTVTVGSDDWAWSYDDTSHVLTVTAPSASDTLNGLKLEGTGPNGATEATTAGGYAVTGSGSVAGTFGGSSFDLSGVTTGNLIVVNGTVYEYETSLSATLDDLLTGGITGCKVLVDGTNLLILKSTASSTADIAGMTVYKATSITPINAE